MGAPTDCCARRRRWFGGRTPCVALLLATLAFSISATSATAYLGRPGFFDTTGIATPMPQLFGVAANAADDVYVVEPQVRQVQHYTAAGVFLGKWGDTPLSGALVDGQFINPIAVAVDQRTGEVYVADQRANRVQKFSATGQFLTKWGRNNGDGSAGRGAGEFTVPRSLAVDGAGNVYVADGVPNGLGPEDIGRIQKFSASGEFIAQWPAGTSIPISGLAVDGAGRVYAATFVLGVLVYAPDGTYIRRLGPAPVSFNSSHYAPTPAAFDVAVDPLDGNLWTTNPDPRRLDKYTPDGRLVAVCSPGTVRHLAVGPSGDVYVTDGSPRVLRIPEVATPETPCDLPLAITGVRLSASRFRAAPDVSSGQRGTKLRFESTKEAQAQVTLERRIRGWRARGRCVAGKPAHARQRCVITRNRGTLKFVANPGFNSHRLSGWYGKYRLAPGDYRLRLRATDIVGHTVVGPTVGFTILH